MAFGRIITPVLRVCLLGLAVLGCDQPEIHPDAGTPDSGRSDSGDVCGPSGDADGDHIPSADEGTGDADGDGTPNAEDADSDGDGVLDLEEAGDADCETPPARCSGDADFLDTDSDEDGLGDGEEAELGTDGCDPDTDGDGQRDLVEGVYERLRCPDEPAACGCAIDPACSVPDPHLYVVLPYGDPTVDLDLTFGTRIRAADVFFLSDTTGSMEPTLEAVQRTVATPDTGLIDRIRESIPDAWFGGGQHDDFPFGGYGGGVDQPFILAIGMTPPERAADVQAAFDAMTIHDGGDGPEAQTEALHQLLTGAGEMWSDASGSTYALRDHAGDCLGSRWGAPCFRPAALPIVVLFTDTCSHNGPAGEDPTCDAYAGITPPPAEWSAVIAEAQRRGMKLIGINASGGSCGGEVTAPSGTTPCYFLRRTAEETGSVDLDGHPLVYDLPDGGASDAVFADTIVHAIETVATQVRLDLQARARDDTSDPPGVDATRFIEQLHPACRAPPVAEPCWEPPAGWSSADAVTAVGEVAFSGVIPGTRVTFRLRLRNTLVEPIETAQVFLARIDLRTGTATLDTREVVFIVPANPG